VLAAAERLDSPRYRAIFVDEGQDLSETAVKLLGKISKHVTIAMDSKQQMYAGRVNLKSASEALGIPKQASQLMASYRCTPLIRDIASVMLENQEDAKNFRSFQLYGINGVEKPVYVESADSDAEWDVFAELVKERALQNQTCAILLPTTKAVFAAKRELEKRNVAVATRSEADFTDLKPEVLTFHSAKGLTVDAIFVPGLTEAFFSSMRSHGEITTLLFVGLTRAARWLCLGTRPDGTLAEISNSIDSLVQRGSLVKHTRVVRPPVEQEEGWL
jgi:superfamily I DNA/RNA helicase